jgi:hypothetical protein
MRGHGAHILMLDCGLERCTAIHLPEELAAPDLYLVALSDAEHYELRDRRGGSHAMRLRRHRRLNRCFEKFEPMLAAESRLQRGSIAGVPLQLCALDDLLRVVGAEFERTPEATLAPPGARTRLSA